MTKHDQKWLKDNQYQYNMIERYIKSKNLLECQNITDKTTK